MIVIIADDFSGAAELAGIAATHGLKAEVQTEFQLDTDAEVIAVDTDTRLMSEQEAAHIVAAVTRQIISARPAWLYKKTDSVLRGHVRAEIEAILNVTGQRDCLLIPANPSKQRVIEGGRYYIGGTPLEDTFFGQDPDYPRHTSQVRGFLGEAQRIITPDASSLDHLRLPVQPQTLRAGAADFFAATLADAAGLARLNIIRQPLKPQRHLLLCGSLAAWETGRMEQMQGAGFTSFTLDSAISPDLWQHIDHIMLAIGDRQSDATETLIERLIEKARPLLVDTYDLCIYLEGGATALAFIRRLGWARFEVVPEGYAGVGSLCPPNGPLLRVKPGSYPWPEELTD